MNPFSPLSNVEQLAAHLREEIRTGRLTGTMPGVAKLVNELGVGTKTVVAAMEQLEKDGLLLNQGMRRGRQIVQADKLGISSLRVRILLYDQNDARSYYNVELLEKLQREGHITTFAAKSLVDLDMDVSRVARFVERNPADAWVIFSGSLEVLQWFEKHDTPCFAFAGRRRTVKISSSGPDKLPAIREATKRLLSLGHRRIVMMAREVRRKPHPGEFERAFLDELSQHGIPLGDYHLPSWEETPEGFHQFLDTLFMHTPPTALIIEEPAAFIAAQNHLAQRGLLAPRDVSMICDDPDMSFSWCRPTVAHIGWNASHCIQQIVRWANSVARGRDKRLQSFTKAFYVDGGTVGPAPK